MKHKIIIFDILLKLITNGLEQIVDSELDRLLKDGKTHTVYYHRKCYICFTDKIRVQKAQQRINRAMTVVKTKLKKTLTLNVTLIAQIVESQNTI